MSILSFGRKTPVLDEFEGLLELHLDGLFHVALRYTHNQAQAEDLVHDTVVRALRFRDKFEKGSNFKAWIYTILTNTFINRYRRQKLEREIIEGSTREDVESQLRSDATRDTARQPEVSYMDRILSDDVMSALDELPEEFRSVVMLCDVEGMSYKDVSEVIDCPIGTVMSRLYRARRMLEKKLANVAKEHGLLRHEQSIPVLQEVDSEGRQHTLKRRRHG